ncbi:MAG: CHASE2 domain-containing protein [Pseudomonadota bacterium]|nr:CHASE2 domain-containing protein [Pseudomonadota bacterium]
MGKYKRWSSEFAKRLRRPEWRHWVPAIIAVAVGVLISATPFGQGWEEDLGLTSLFRLRGPIEPPHDVVVISIDRASSDHLGLPNNPRKWPRDLHARLLDRLKEAGASVVAFDMMFQDPRDPARDRAFGEAVRRAGNVILFELLTREIVPTGTGGASGPGEAIIEQRVPPIPALADAALGLAPFALPKVPIKVSQVWLFKPEAGGAPTLPMVVFQAHAKAAYAELLSLIEELDPEAYQRFRDGIGGAAERFDERVRVLRRMLQLDPRLPTRLNEKLAESWPAGSPKHEEVAALISAYAGQHSLYLNYYGPPRTIETISYYRVLDGDALEGLDLAGRAVFVGAAARLQPEQRDGFYTAHTGQSGLDISGVEIAATTFANLLERRPVRPLAPLWELALLVVWGILLGLSLRWLPGGWIPLAGVGAGGAYFGIALSAFTQAQLWMPLVTPLLVQLPVAILGALLWRYRDVHRERENIRRAFGMHLPLPVVDQLARGIDDFRASTEHAYGICLASDGEQYAALAERLDPAALKRFMNDYYAAVFPPIRSRDGVVADVIGDAMFAIWAAGNERPELRQRACEAALSILDAVADFNHRNPEHRLPTRLGLHCGELVLGHVGAVDHFEYRPVGDIVNTASRIEGLSKHLGTRLLVSADVIADLNGFHTREVGRFVLKGKTRPLSIFELMAVRDRNEDATDWLRHTFAQGLEAFYAGSWKEALRWFEAIEKEHGRDGPTTYYLALCRRYLAEPPTQGWSGVVTLATK